MIHIKVYAAYDKATKNQGSPTVIIAKTIKDTEWVRQVKV